MHLFSMHGGTQHIYLLFVFYISIVVDTCNLDVWSQNKCISRYAPKQRAICVIYGFL